MIERREKKEEMEEEEVSRHHICQKIYATAIFGPKNLRKKSVNRDKNEFATK